MPPEAPILKLAKRLGIVLVPRTLQREFTWDGKTLALIAEPSAFNPNAILHDICHWLVCPPKRRELPEFGLGPDPWWRSKARLVISQRRAQLEEHHASILEYVFHAWFGLPGTPAAVFPDTSHLNQSCRGLAKRNLLVEGANPKATIPNFTRWRPAPWTLPEES